MTDDGLIKRAREYLKDKYLDLADVPKFIEKLVQLYEANERLTTRLRELEADKEFDTAELGYDDICTVCGHPRYAHPYRHPFMEQTYGRKS